MGRGASATLSSIVCHPDQEIPGEGPDSVPGVQLPWRPIGLQATSTCDTVVPAYDDTAGRSPFNPDHAPVQLSGAGNVTARISLCGAGRTLIRKMTGTITVPVDHAEQRLPIPLFTISFYCITDKVATNTHIQFSTLCRHMPLVSISYGALLRICLII